MTAFDDLVAALDAAMVVVMAKGADGEVDGCLVGFHSQTSITPPRYTVWLSHKNRTYRLAQTATELSVHRLSADMHDLAELFGGHTADDGDALPDGTWHPNADGVPVLSRPTSHLVGRIVERLDVGGDHVGFVLDPGEVHVEHRSEPSLRLTQVGHIRPGHPA